MSRSILDEGRLRGRVRRGDVQLGTFLGMGSPIAAEAVAAAGADWLLVDLEHGAGTEAGAALAVPAARAYGVPVVARVETPERIRVGKVLDLGFSGVMFPRIDSVEDASRAIRMLRYPPDGVRGAATYNRQARFGLDPAVLGRVADDLVGIIQIESLGALDTCEELAALDGVDVLFVGPVDLSYALGAPFDFASDRFLAALDRVIGACRLHGKAAGIMASDVDTAAKHLARGFRFVSVASDVTLLAKTYSAAFSALRDA